MSDSPLLVKPVGNFLQPAKKGRGWAAQCADDSVLKFAPPATSDGTTYTLPAAKPASHGFLRSDSTGAQTWTSVPASDVTGLAAVATTGAYSSLSGTPTLGSLAALNAAPAGTLTGATLAANVLASSLTSVGIIGSGTWRGSVLDGEFGGTGVANVGRQVTLGGNFTTVGSFNTTLTVGADTNVTLPAAGTLAALSGTNTWSAVNTFSQAVDATSTDGIVLATSAVATVGAQKYSPRLRLLGSGWKTNATAGPQAVDAYLEVQPVQGGANPSGNLLIRLGINGVYTTVATISSAGVFSIVNDLMQTGSGSVFQWQSGFQFRGIANNQMRLTNITATSGFTLSAVTDNTLTLLDRAGTAAGALVAGAASFSGGISSTRINPRVVAAADSTTWTPVADTSDVSSQTNTQAAGTLTIAAPTYTVAPVDGQQLMLRIKSNSVQTFNFNAIYRASTDSALPSTSSGGGLWDYLAFRFNYADTKWDYLGRNLGH